LKKLVYLGGAAGAACALLVSLGHAADHLDGTNAAMTPMADIADLYAWNTSDAMKVNLAMTVSPADQVVPGGRHFGPGVVYAFHVNSRPSFTGTPAETKVICKFASDTDGQCWVVNPAGTVVDYVKGDFSATAGVTSESGKVKVFAGRRSDPFFFNFGGTKKAIHITENLCAGEDGTGTTEGECPPPAAANATDAAGCFKEAAVGSARADFLRTVIKTKPSTTVIPGTTCGSADADCFLQFNVMAIVVQIDKTELNQGSNHLVSVWASTHTGS
jgi:hypothetical protein